MNKIVKGGKWQSFIPTLLNNNIWTMIIAMTVCVVIRVSRVMIIKCFMINNTSVPVIIGLFSTVGKYLVFRIGASSNVLNVVGFKKIPRESPRTPVFSPTSLWIPNSNTHGPPLSLDLKLLFMSYYKSYRRELLGGLSPPSPLASYGPAHFLVMFLMNKLNRTMESRQLEWLVDSWTQCIWY